MRDLLAAASIALAAGVAGAACPTVTSTTPYADFWAYGFGNGSTRYAPTFASPFETVDADRLGYYLVVFEPAGDDPAALPPIRSLRLEMRLLNSSTFDPNNTVLYDPTYDSQASYLDPTLDTDPGRPIELYGVEFIDPVDLGTLTEATGLNIAPPELYAAQPVDFPGTADEPRRVMYSVDGAPEPGTAPGFDTLPLAIATSPDAGATIPDGGRLIFEASLSPAARAYLTEQFRETGRVALIVSSLHATLEFGQGGSVIYPRLATKESFGLPDPSLTVAFGSPADFNGDGSVNVNDLLSFLGAYRSGGPAADFNGDGPVNVNDLLSFLGAYRAGGSGGC